MLGIDVSKDRLDVTWRDQQTAAIRWQGSVPNSPRGVAALLRRTPAACAIVLEPTGRWAEAVARQAEAAGRAVLLAPPRRARAFLYACQPRAKTDRLDSAGLALYGLRQPLRPYPLKAPHVDHLSQLLAARRGLSRALAALEQQRQALPRAAAALAPAGAALRAQRAALDRELARHVRAHPDFGAAAALQAVPGVGPVVAAAVVACLRQRRFTHPDQFVAYIGLDLRVHQSGARTGRRALSKHGDAELRRLLYLAAAAASRARADRTFAERYARERAKGLPPTAALNAVARKLAKVCWALVTHGAAYDPARVDRQPARPRLASGT
jgi:transposase